MLDLTPLFQVIETTEKVATVRMSREGAVVVVNRAVVVVNRLEGDRNLISGICGLCVGNVCIQSSSG